MPSSGSSDASSVETIFVTATSVHTGQARVFTGAEVTVDALLASACLPFIFQAVEIDGEPYWDGGYTGNPAIYPLIYDSRSLDVLLVRINPLARPGTPQHSMDILDRLSEITFNASLIGEMRAIAFVSRPRGEIQETAYRLWRLRRDAVRGRFERAGVPVSVWNDESSLAAALEEVGATRRRARTSRV